MQPLKFNGKELPEWLNDELYRISPSPGPNELIGMLLDDYIERKVKEMERRLIKIGHIVGITTGPLAGHFGKVVDIDKKNGLYTITPDGLTNHVLPVQEIFKA